MVLFLVLDGRKVDTLLQVIVFVLFSSNTIAFIAIVLYFDIFHFELISIDLVN